MYVEVRSFKAMANYFQSKSFFQKNQEKNMLRVNLKDNVKHCSKIFLKLGRKIMAQFCPFVYVPIFQQTFGFFQE